MNSFDGRIKADAAILPAGQNSSGQNSISVYVTNTANVMLDIDGYFITPGSSTLAFFSLPPCRVVDTRGANGPLGGPTLVNRQVRDFPILQSELRHTVLRASVLTQCHRASKEPAAAGLPDRLAGRVATTCRFHFERSHRSDYGQRRDRPGRNQR